MRRGGRVRDVSDWSAGRIRGRRATRAAQRKTAIDDWEDDMYSGDEMFGDDITSGVVEDDGLDWDEVDFDDLADDLYYGE